VEIREFLGKMTEHALMLEIDDGYLSLSIMPQRKYLTPDVIGSLMYHSFSI
jgi:hypothetical protein